MKMRGALANGMMLAGLLLSLTGCSATRPKIETVSARITNIDLEGIDIAFDLGVLNPYPITLGTPEGRYAIDIAGSAFVESDAVPPADLPAGKVGTLTLPARMDYARLWSVYQSLGDAPEVPYKLQGALVVPVMGQSLEVPFSHEGEFPVLRAPRLSVTEVRTTEVSVRRAAVDVEVEMENPNVFSLGVADLGYDLKLGDVRVANIQAHTADSIGARRTGHLNLYGEITAAGALLQLVRGGKLGTARLTATGAIQTPYGPVNLPR